MAIALHMRDLIEKTVCLHGVSWTPSTGTGTEPISEASLPALTHG